MGAKIKLAVTGRVVEFDLSRISVSEFRLAVKDGSDQEESDKVLAKASGMKLKDLQGLPFPDYQILVAGWWEAAMHPVHQRAKVRMSDDEMKRLNLKAGQVVEIAAEGDPDDPN